MAKSPDGKPVKSGRTAELRVVKNTAPYGNAAYHYLAVRVQWPGGKKESLLFTEAQVRAARARARKNPEDVPRAAHMLELLD
jgi:hypothetical protein